MDHPRDIVRRLTEKGKGCMLCGLNYPIKYYEGNPHHENGGDFQVCTNAELKASPIEEIALADVLVIDEESFDPEVADEVIAAIEKPAPKKSKPKRAKRK